MAGLGALDGGIFGSEALAASGDGSVIVGQDFIATKQTQAFLWTSSLGMVSLRDYLIAHGADLTGWSLASASGISADGRTIVGTGINPQGQTEAWIATIPEPSSLVLAAMSGLGLLGIAAQRRSAA